MGYFIAGIAGANSRCYWASVVAAFAWAAVIAWFDVLSGNQFGEARVFGEPLAPRVFGALFVVSVTYFVARAVRSKDGQKERSEKSGLTQNEAMTDTIKGGCALPLL